jgi:hypothetical protein
MIEVQDISKRHGDKLAVDSLTFTVRPGVNGSRKLTPSGHASSLVAAGTRPRSRSFNR